MKSCGSLPNIERRRISFLREDLSSGQFKEYMLISNTKLIQRIVFIIYLYMFRGVCNIIMTIMKWKFTYHSQLAVSCLFLAVEIMLKICEYNYILIAGGN